MVVQTAVSFENGREAVLFRNVGLFLYFFFKTVAINEGSSQGKEHRERRSVEPGWKRHHCNKTFATRMITTSTGVLSPATVVSFSVWCKFLARTF